MALERNHLGNDSFPIELRDNLFLLAVAPLGFEFNNGVYACHRSAKMLGVHLHSSQKLLHFGCYTIRIARGNPEHHDSPLQVEAICGPADHHEAEKHEPPGIGSDTVNSSTWGHSNRGFHEDGCGSVPSPHATPLPPNFPYPHKSYPLNNFCTHSHP